MNNKPLISCIVIFLNTEKFIEEAIESIFAQTYENWELLLVDDGSTDGSCAIALRYAQQYPDKVRYLEHEGHQNCGMSAARNLGIRNAKGEYVAFLDSDDVWLPQKLERQLAMFDAHPEVAMVCGPNQIWFSWTGNPEDLQKDWIHTLGTGITPNRSYNPPTLMSLFWQSKARTPGTCSVLIRREVFAEIGGFEESFRGMFEDRVFFSKVYLRFPILMTDECFDRYRSHSTSACSVSRKKKSWFRPEPAYLTFLSWMENYLTVQGVEDSEVWRSFRRKQKLHTHPILFVLLQIKLQWRSLWVEMRKRFVADGDGRNLGETKAV
jgi:glycosyltransferase involved in cell wall biosynthesis